jgi:hypothetical protein
MKPPCTTVKNCESQVLAWRNRELVTKTSLWLLIKSKNAGIRRHTSYITKRKSLARSTVCHSKNVQRLTRNVSAWSLCHHLLICIMYLNTLLDAYFTTLLQQYFIQSLQTSSRVPSYSFIAISNNEYNIILSYLEAKSWMTDLIENWSQKLRCDFW